jgi:gamma-glutamyltranspeptidase
MAPTNGSRRRARLQIGSPGGSRIINDVCRRARRHLDFGRRPAEAIKTARTG